MNDDGLESQNRQAESPVFQLVTHSSSQRPTTEQPPFLYVLHLNAAGVTRLSGGGQQPRE